MSKIPLEVPYKDGMPLAFTKIMKYVRHNNAKKKHTALKSESTSTELRKYQSLIPKEWV